VSAAEHLNEALAAEADAYRTLLAGGDARPAFARARDAYLASHAKTGPASWGRLVGGLKMAILAGEGVEDAARAAIAEAGEPQSPAAAYARALAQVATGDEPDVRLMLEAGDAFARTGRALAAIAAADATAYASVLRGIVADFAARDQHLSGVPIADTALVLERLAEPRGMAVGRSAGILPGDLGL
jgi:hypothetical protein